MKFLPMLIWSLRLLDDAKDFVKSMPYEDYDVFNIFQQFISDINPDCTYENPVIVSKKLLEKFFNPIKDLKENNVDYYNFLLLLSKFCFIDISAFASDAYLKLFLEKVKEKYPTSPNEEIIKFMRFVLHQCVPETEQIRIKAIKELDKTWNYEKSFCLCLKECIQLAERLQQLKK